MVQAVGWTGGRLLGKVGGWRFPWAWNFRVVVGMDEEGKGRDWLSLLRFGGFAVGGGARGGLLQISVPTSAVSGVRSSHGCFLWVHWPAISLFGEQLIDQRIIPLLMQFDS